MTLARSKITKISTKKQSGEYPRSVVLNGYVACHYWQLYMSYLLVQTVIVHISDQQLLWNFVVQSQQSRWPQALQ